MQEKKRKLKGTATVTTGLVSSPLGEYFSLLSFKLFFPCRKPKDGPRRTLYCSTFKTFYIRTVCYGYVELPVKIFHFWKNSDSAFEFENKIT